MIGPKTSQNRLKECDVKFSSLTILVKYQHFWSLEVIVKWNTKQVLFWRLHQRVWSELCCSNLTSTWNTVVFMEKIIQILCFFLFRLWQFDLLTSPANKWPRPSARQHRRSAVDGWQGGLEVDHVPNVFGNLGGLSWKDSSILEFLAASFYALFPLQLWKSWLKSKKDFIDWLHSMLLTALKANSHMHMQHQFMIVFL